MKRAIALSRCEVDGKVYLPTDDMDVTDEQLTYLLSENAAVEIKLQAAMAPPPVNATIEQLDVMYAGKTGKVKPHKEK